MDDTYGTLPEAVCFVHCMTKGLHPVDNIDEHYVLFTTLLSLRNVSVDNLSTVIHCT